MASNCAFLLDNGRPCGCPALHDGRYCRHHTPAAVERRLASAGAPESARTRAAGSRQATAGLEPSDPGDASAVWTPGVLKAYWKRHHRIIATASATNCDEIFEMVIDALAERDISPRSAGRLLQAIVDRQKILNREEQEAAVRAAEQQLRQR